MRISVFIVFMTMTMGVYAQKYKVGTTTALWKVPASTDFSQARSVGLEYVEVAFNQCYRGVPANEVIPRVRDMKAKIDSAGIKVWSIHLPFSRTLDISVLDEKKRKENVVVVVVKEREEILQCFEQNIAVATVAVKKKMDAYLQKLSPELMQAAIEYSALMGAKGWRYVQAVLDSCIERGISTPQEFEEKCRRHSRSQKAAEDRAAAQNKAAPDKRSCLSSQPSPPARSGDGSESSIDFEAIRQYMTHGSTDQTLCSS